MAGKVEGVTAFRSLTYPTGARMGQRLTRAYAEGRAQIPSASNPHTAGTPEATAWQDGFDNLATGSAKYETAVS